MVPTANSESQVSPRWFVATMGAVVDDGGVSAVVPASLWLVKGVYLVRDELCINTCRGLKCISDEDVLREPTEQVRMPNSGALRWRSVGRVCVNDFMPLHPPQLLLPMVLLRRVLPTALKAGAGGGCKSVILSVTVRVPLTNWIGRGGVRWSRPRYLDSARKMALENVLKCFLTRSCVSWFLLTCATYYNI